jgi:hypothetical protein
VSGIQLYRSKDDGLDECLIVLWHNESDEESDEDDYDSESDNDEDEDPQEDEDEGEKENLHESDGEDDMWFKPKRKRKYVNESDDEREQSDEKLESENEESDSEEEKPILQLRKRKRKNQGVLRRILHRRQESFNENKDSWPEKKRKIEENKIINIKNKLKLRRAGKPIRRKRTQKKLTEEDKKKAKHIRQLSIDLQNTLRERSMIENAEDDDGSILDQD